MLERADGVRLERPVTLDDMKAVHRSCKHCFGFFMLNVQRKGKPLRVPCTVGMREFAIASQGRTEEGPGGEAWWITGFEPERIHFTLMFVDGMMEWAWQRDFALQSKIWGLLQKHQANLAREAAAAAVEKAAA